MNFGLRLEPDQKLLPLSLVRELRRSAICVSFTEALAERVFSRAPDCYKGGEYFARLTADEPLTGHVRIAAEQHLNLQSRVTIGAEKDAFGLNRIVLDWQVAGRYRDHAHITAFGASSPRRRSAGSRCATGCWPSVPSSPA